MSDAELLAFHTSQVEMLNDSKGAADKALVAVDAILFPTRTKDPDLASSALDVMARAIDSNLIGLRQRQTDESSRQWIRHVAATSLGTNDRDADLSNVRTANTAPDTHPQHMFDGLIDLHFYASANRPQDKVTLASARMTGVKADAVAFLQNVSLLDSGLPLRALGTPSTDVSTSLAVVRDEKANIVFTDRIGADSQPAHWFEKKGGGDAEIGARMVMAELATDPLGDKLKAK